MTKSLTGLTLILALLLSLSALGKKARAEAIDRDTPCKQIERACFDAGYVRGLSHEGDGKDLDKACVQPILLGQTVPGIKVGSDTVQKCVESQQPRGKQKDSPKWHQRS